MKRFFLDGMPIEAVIFDVDGTLWDSTDVVAESWNRVLGDKSINAEVLSHVFGKTMTEIGEMLFPNLDAAGQHDLMERLFASENALLAEKPGVFYPGTCETLRALHEYVGVYIVSNCQKGYIEAFLQSSGMEPFVDGFLCFGDTNQSKDKTILELLKKHGIERSKAVYVGDTQGDANSCHAACIPFIWAQYGFGSIDSGDAILSISQMSDLLALVREE